MDEREEEMYLQNLEEYILDEDKIVTYKWLSKSLNLHVNVAKQLLHTFFLRNNKQNLISATYLLTGKLRSTGKNQITVVGQDKYEEVRALFESLFSEHVYSVQKSQKIPIPSILFTVNSQPVEEKGGCTSSLGAIKCKGSIQRAAEELSLLRISIPPAPTTSGTSKLKQVTTSVTKESEKVSPTKPKADEKNGKEKKNTKAKGGLAAMFAVQTAKGSSKKESEPKGPTEVKISPTKSKDDDKSGKGKKDAKVKGGLAAMFAAQTVKASSKKNLDDEKASTTGTNTINELTEATTSLAKAKKQTPKRSSANKKKVDGKKRKRIVQQDLESSDEDMFSEEDKASSREPSPEPVLRAKPLESDNEEDVIQPTPPANGTGSGRCRRRRKVMKDKTFMDEDGYVVTQKVTEYESYSESDSEESDVKKVKELDPVAVNSKKSTPPLAKSKAEKNKVSSKKASPAKHKSPAKSKQQSLTSFFKKKE